MSRREECCPDRPSAPRRTDSVGIHDGEDARGSSVPVLLPTERARWDNELIFLSLGLDFVLVVFDPKVG